MKINGEKLKTLAVFPSMMTVPDCIVVASNKLGRGHGEAKFYIAPKERMYDYYGEAGFFANCFMLKSDLIAYMNAIKSEYMHPSQNYAQKDQFPTLWTQRFEMIQNLDDIISFTIYDQDQIAGDRGYVNSNDIGYKIIRQIALPLVSYIYSEKINTGNGVLFYWKLFVDFEAIWEKQNGPLVFNYGRQRQGESIIENNNTMAATETERQTVNRTRVGQSKYREQLLEQCPFCPFTMIADERLLIASHIKPWIVSNDQERIDPYNGYMLSPLYDKLFDKGFITFTENRHVILSEFISPNTWKRINLENNTFLQSLVMDDNRIKYLKFHQQCVFKGTL